MKMRLRRETRIPGVLYFFPSCIVNAKLLRYYMEVPEIGITLHHGPEANNINILDGEFPQPRIDILDTLKVVP